MSDETKPALGAGDVPITLGGKEMVLKPSLQACVRLSKGPGLVDWISKLQKLQLDAFVAITAAGLGMEHGPSKDLPDLIYKEGMLNLLPKFLKFIDMLAYGGRPPPEEKNEGDETKSPLET